MHIIAGKSAFQAASAKGSADSPGHSTHLVNRSIHEGKHITQGGNDGNKDHPTLR